MKKVKFIFYTFAIVGVIALIIDYFVFQSESQLAKNGIETKGIVIEYSEDNSDRTTIYFPIILFHTEDNRNITFVASQGSSHFDYEIGEEVDVIYLPDNPQKVAINSFLGQYGGTLVLSSIGGIFFFTGAIPLFYLKRKANKNKQLLRDGLPIKAKISMIAINKRVRINNNSPYQIIAKHSNTSDNHVTRYISDYIFFDPTPYIKDEFVTVYIDKKNPKKYYLDISFLANVKEA